MKKKYFNLRLSERRLNKLRVYAVTHDKTMTQVIEELIDGLSLESLGDSVPTRESNSSHNSIRRMSVG